MFTLLLIAAIGISHLVTVSSVAYVKTGECMVNFKDWSRTLHECIIIIINIIFLFCRMTKLASTVTLLINNMEMIQATILLHRLLLTSYASQVRSFFAQLKSYTVNSTDSMHTCSWKLRWQCSKTFLHGNQWCWIWRNHCWRWPCKDQWVRLWYYYKCAIT